MTAALLLVLLGQTSAYPPPPAVTEAPDDPTAVTVFRGALELSGQSFPAGVAGGDQDGMGVVTPVLSIDSGEQFGFELGANLRLRLIDTAPAQRAGDIGGLLRGADWDERSDFGQLLRALRIGTPADAVSVRAGAMPLVTLGHGHLVSRYSNQTNPDYHPAGAGLSLTLGPTRTEVFASDVLAARLVAAEVSVDVGTLFLSGRPELKDRFHLALSAAHDFGLSMALRPAITLAGLDADATLVRGEGYGLDGYVSLAGRGLEAPAELGVALGLRGKGQPLGLELSGRAEVRTQGGGFHQGLFGPDYELSRFVARGTSGPGVSDEGLPHSGSAYLELLLGAGPLETTEEGEGRLSLSAAAEVFLWGRVDADLAVALRTPGNQGVLVGRVTLTGGNQAPRVNGSAEFRYRFLPSIYALASAGTLYFPQLDGTLTRGLYAGLGAGFDFER